MKPRTQSRDQRPSINGGRNSIHCGRFDLCGPALSTFIVLVLLVSAAAGQTGDGPQTAAGDVKRPAYVPFDRSEEDWSVLKDPKLRTDRWDRLKYIPLRSKADWYVTLAGQIRPFYEVYRNYHWSVGPQDSNGYYLNRVLGSADFHLGEQSRIFLELQSGLVFDRTGGPRLVEDEDKLDLQQLYFEVSSRSRRERPLLTFRIGRQQLQYGEGTLLDVRDLNVRRSFDGVKLTIRPRAWQFDLFAMKPDQSKPGLFENSPDSSKTLWGVYAITTKHLPSWMRQLDVYYLGLDRKSALFNQGVGRDQRHTLGILMHGREGNFSYYSEGDLQLGKFGSGNVLAWKYGQDLSYAFPRLRSKPTVSLSGAISSGDKNPADPNLQTFYPLFPKGLYYGYIDDSGSLNAIVVHPQASFQVSKTITVTPDAFFFWRQQAADGLYSAPGVLLRTAQGVSSKYVGAMQQLAVTWIADRHTTVQALGSYYEAGSFLKETLPHGRNIGYVSAKIIYTF